VSPDRSTDARRWSVREPPVDPGSLGEGLDPLLARLLTLRGVERPSDVRPFLEPKLSDLADPVSYTDMPVASARLADACVRGESVAVHGDYDVDGVVSTTLAVDFLRKMGLRHVVPSLPHRIRDGYGISAERVENLFAEGCTLLVAVDCGATAHAAISRANELGMDVVVLDHHQLRDGLPPAHAVVNPVREAEPDGVLCAAGVVFMALVDVRRRLREAGFFEQVVEPNLRHYLDLVALATIADMVPLAGANRLLARHGLAVLAERRRPGIAALLEVADVHPDAPIDAAVCGFRLGPRINAAGRLDDPRRALDLLLCQDRGTAMAAAQDLDRINQRRRQLEDLVLKEAEEALGDDVGERRGLTLMGRGWHPGVLGIVASRLMQRFHRPVLLLAGDGDLATGSARSVPGVDLVAALGRGESMLERFGGHAAAAGVSMATSEFERFQRWFETEAFADEPAERWQPAVEVDAELDVADVTEALANQLRRLDPHGIGNPEPRFIARDVPVRGVRQVRKGAVQLRVGASPGIAAIAFRPGRPAAEFPERIHMVYSFGMRHFRGQESLQIQVHEIEPANAT